MRERERDTDRERERERERKREKIRIVLKVISYKFGIHMKCIKCHLPP